MGEQINLRDKRKDDVKLKKEKGERKEEKSPSPKASEEKEKEEKGERREEKVPVEKEIKVDENDGFLDFDEEIVEPEKNNTPPGAQGEQEIKKEELYSPTLNDLKVAVTHTVAAKETLYGLSKMYGVTIAQIQEWNGLKDNNLSIGQKLIVGYK